MDKCYEKKKYKYIVIHFPKDRVSSFSILMTNSEFNLVNFIEKPTQEQVEYDQLVRLFHL